MSVDTQKLAAWIAAAGGVPVELLFVHVRGEETERMRLAEWLPPYEPAKVVEEAFELAQGDCDAQRARSAYVLTAKGKREVHRRFALVPRSDSDVTASVTEPPTPAGLAAQMMRHEEAKMRSTVGARADVAEGWRELFGEVTKVMAELRGHNTALQEREIKTVELYGKLRSEDHVYQLETLKMAASSSRTEKLLETVVAPLIPEIYRKLGVGSAPASPASPAPSPASPASPPPASPPPTSPPSSGTTPPAVDASPAAAAPPADAPAASSGAASDVPGSFREVALLLAKHGVDPDKIADLASQVPEADRFRVQALLLQTVQEAITS